MIKNILCLCFFLTSLNVNAQMDSVSYSIGVIIAQNLQKQEITDVTTEDVAAGLADLLNGNELKISKEDADRIFGEYVNKKKQAKEEERLAQFAGAKKAGEDFLAENGKRPGVTTTESGLQYEVVNQGLGENAKLSNSVKVHYHGTLIDGKVFDSSVNRGEPISFPLGNVIKGWQEGLSYMNVGSKYKLFIPYDLAYGTQGAGADIGPYSALIFEVELLEIN